MFLGVKRATLQHLRPDRPLYLHIPTSCIDTNLVYIFLFTCLIALTVQTTFHVRSTSNMDEESLLSLQRHATMEIERELELSLNCMCIFSRYFVEEKYRLSKYLYRKKKIDEDLPLPPLSLFSSSK